MSNELLTMLYSPVASQAGEIRVLELVPGQFTDDLVICLHAVSLHEGSPPRYEALSYVWGTGASTSKVNLGDTSGPSLPITANLESALRYLRLPNASRTLWVDALCINQMDMQERSAQVQLMGEIYSAADNVIVWLGPAEEDSGTMAALVRIRDWDARSIQLPRDEAVLLAPTMYRLLNRPWFERTWVVQELALSNHEPVVHVGYWSFGWKQFLRLATHIERHIDHVPSVMVTDYVDRLGRVIDFSEIRNAWREPTRQATAFFPYQVRRTLYLSATDPRDKIFGLLGISKFESERPVPDYKKSVQEVYAEATAIMMRNRYVSAYFESPLRPSKDLHIRLSAHPPEWPSWVPNLAYATKTMVTGQSFTGVHRGHQQLLEAPMDNLPLMLNIKPEERVDMLSQDLPPQLTAVEISADNTVMSTHGQSIGTITATSRNSLKHIEWAEPTWLSLISVYDVYHELIVPYGICTEDYLRALLPEERRYSWRTPARLLADVAIFDNFLNADRENMQAYGALFASTEHADLGPGSEAHNLLHELAEGISSKAKNRIVFVTDNGRVGISYHEDLHAGIRRRDLLAGLFGVNFPFILRRRDQDPSSETYRLINVASVANHQWGHEFLGNTFTASGFPAVKHFGPDVTWCT